MSSWVLDASALIACVHHEPGEEVVTGALLAGAVMSSVNLSEVVARLSDAGMPAEDIHEALNSFELTIDPFDGEGAFAAGLLRPSTRRAGLSLGDRACLALAMRTGLPALTGDRAWRDVGSDLGVEVSIFR
ncbi:MAG: type II toxin-antitoxin system VapC family toxin [Chloroflexi bacterium]|nr:type II toxin-antitoxin system VapC family toxin [Chloroflexota bacterium]